MDDPTSVQLGALAELVSAGGVLALTGAGLSTESGIPDYRGPSGSLRRHTPMTYQAFTGDPMARRRYWARSQLGWRHVVGATPNAGHRAVAELERRGFLAGIVTQNVDGLHHGAGATSVVELHGSLARVMCLSCRGRTPRADLDARLRAANPDFDAIVTAINPDGDAEVADEHLDGFRLVDCTACGGVLKPDVIFFGENVPRERVQRCYELVDAARVLLVLGSSLTVMSGYRFVRHAAKRATPVVIVNQGPTRGDGDAILTVDAPLGAALPEILRCLPDGQVSTPSRSAAASVGASGSRGSSVACAAW